MDMSTHFMQSLTWNISILIFFSLISAIKICVGDDRAMKSLNIRQHTIPNSSLDNRTRPSTTSETKMHSLLVFVFHSIYFPCCKFIYKIHVLMFSSLPLWLWSMNIQYFVILTSILIVNKWHKYTMEPRGYISITAPNKQWCQLCLREGQRKREE